MAAIAGKRLSGTIEWKSEQQTALDDFTHDSILKCSIARGLVTTMSSAFPRVLFQGLHESPRNFEPWILFLMTIKENRHPRLQGEYYTLG